MVMDLLKRIILSKTGPELFVKLILNINLITENLYYFQLPLQYGAIKIK
jgi:hypothetical protein